MGVAIDNIKCRGGRVSRHQEGGLTIGDPKKKIKYEKVKRELTSDEARVTMDVVNRNIRLRGYQGTLTEVLQEKHPDLPLNELLSELTGREPGFSRRDVPSTGEELIKKYGDLSIESEEIIDILGPEAAKEYFRDTKTGRTKGKGDVGLQRFGFRNMIYPQFRSKNTGLYQYLDKKTTEGFQAGGGVGIGMAFQQMMSSMTDEQKEKLMAGDTNWMGLEGKAASPIGGAITAGAEMVTGVMSEFQSNISSGYDTKEDPGAASKKTAQLEVGKDIVSGTAKGAAIGSVIPGVGTAIGAGIGFVGSGIKAIVGSKRRKEEREELSTQWAGNWADKYFKAQEGYEEGGAIKGPGGPKTDSINMKAKAGSFIVPAINSEAGMKLGRDYLGWTDESIAAKNNGGTKIKVSKGEVLYTPEEVEKLGLLGVDLNKLAPNAKTEYKLAKGGRVPSRAKAAEILEDGTINGKPLTEKQERFFQAVAHGWKPDRFAGGGSTGGIDSSLTKEEYAENIMRSDYKSYQAGEKTGIIGHPKIGKDLPEGLSYGEYSDYIKTLNPFSQTHPRLNQVFTPLRSGKFDKLPYTEFEETLPSKMTKTITSRFVDGGWVYDKKTGITMSQEEYDKKYPPAKVTSKSTHEPAVNQINQLRSGVSETEAETEIEEDKFKLTSLFPEMAATAQILGAIKGLSDAGKKPDMVISSRLKKLARDTQEAATFGLEPNVRNAYMREIERTRRDVMNRIIARGGSPGEINAALGKITSTTLAAKARIPVMEEEMKLRKTAINIGVEQSLAQMQYDKSRVDREDWFRYQEAWGTMLSEGLKNFIGARQYKENLDYMKSVGSTVPSFTDIKTK